MFKELVEKGEALDREGKLIPTGYGEYKSSPIRLVVHIFPDKFSKGRIKISEYTGGENRALPKLSIRTNSIIPYPLADESGYVLGIDKIKEDEIDERATEKNEKFNELLEEMLKSDLITNTILLEAIKLIKELFKDIKSEIAKSEFNNGLLNKDWIVFVYEKGEFEGKYLFEHDEVKEFWKEFIKHKLCYEQKSYCSICGSYDYLVKNIPSGIAYRGSSKQFTSINKDAFVSYRYKNKNAPLGICLSCADKISKALGFLINNGYKETIFDDKSVQGEINNDSSRNLDAVFWIKEETKFSNSREEFNLLDTVLMPLRQCDEIKIETTDQLIHDFLKSPWTGQKSSLNLNENEVNILILSPNGPGRMVIREFIKVSADRIKNNLLTYFNALNIVGINGEQGKPHTIQQLLEPLKTTDPNIAKSLLRTAYLGDPPVYALLHTAIQRFCIVVMQSDKKEGKKKGEIPSEELLVSLIKLYLHYNKKKKMKGDGSMEDLNERRQDPAYQSGVLLAVLEEIQKRAISRDLSATITKRYFGGVLAAPKVVLTMLVEMATKAHMPKIERERRGHKEIESLLEDTLSFIDDLGGFPNILSMEKQGEFILGYYKQKAKFSKEREDYIKTKGGNSNGERVISQPE